ncbi:MAG: nitroreductase [Bradymonadia bacterium]
MSEALNADLEGARAALDLITGRRTAHKYAAGAVHPDVLSQAIQAANAAPNHKHTWPWRFTVVGPEARKHIAEVALEKAAQKSGGTLAEPRRTLIEEKVVNPGALVVVTQVLSPDPHRAQEDYASVACAIQNFTLVAHAAGYGTKWSTGSLTRLPEVIEAVGIDLETEGVVGFIWMGVPKYGAEVNRPPVEAITRQTA